MNKEHPIPKIQSGLERLLDDRRGEVAGRRVGLVAHPASVTSELVHAYFVLQQAGARVVQLFGPEHGFAGEAQDMETVEQGRDASFEGVPVHSLYGATLDSLTPPDDRLAELELLVIDLADVGSRYYTFVWTAVLCLEACHRLGVPVLLLDRPNPLGGVEIEGAPQQDGFLSFVGLHPIPVRHGLTPGELVSLMAARQGLRDGLTVVPMRGWRREMYYDETGLPWVFPSPNMPTLDTAIVYPGGCLLEATGISEGRGTTRPFELVGAPGVDGYKLARRLEEFDLKGVAFRPAVFKPGFQKHAGAACGGVQLHVLNRSAFRPYRTGLALLSALKQTASDAFVWRAEPYEFVTDRPAIDLLTGSSSVREGIDAGVALDDLTGVCETGVGEFEEERQGHLLY